jgi:autotransporter-associated beta strand protein
VATFTTITAGDVIDLNATTQTVAALSITAAATSSFTIGNGTLGLATGALTRAATTGTTTINADVILGANASWDIKGTLISNGAISGNVDFAKLGTGTLQLNGANTFGGAGKTFNLNAGTVQMGSAAAIGAPGTALTVNGAATLSNTSGSAITLSNQAINLNGNLTFAGTQNLNTGTAGVNLIGATARTLTVSSTGILTVDGTLTGAAAFTKAGTGTLQLNQANTNTGSFTLSAGKLWLANAGADSLGASGTAFTVSATSTLDNVSGSAMTLGTHPIALNGNLTFTGSNELDFGANSVTIGGTGTRTLTVTASKITVGGNITSASLPFTKAGAGILLLSGTNSFGGGFNISAGKVQLGSAGALGSGALAITGTSTLENTLGTPFTLANATLALTGNLTFTGPNISPATNELDTGSAVVTLNGSRTVTVTNSNDKLTVATPILEGTPAGKLTKTGAGTIILTGANTYTGGTVVSAGTFALSGTSSSLEGNVNLSSSTSKFDLTALSGPATASIGSLSGATSSKLLLGSSTLSLEDDTSTTFSGNISGSGSVTKNGTGNLTLSGNNGPTGGGFSGNLNVHSGSLIVGGTTSLSSLASMTLSGGTLNVATRGGTTGALSVSADSMIDFGLGGAATALTFSGDGGASWGKVLSIWNWGGGTWAAGVNNTLTFSAFSGANLANVQFYSDNGITPIGVGGGFLGGASSGNLIPVPEPTAALAGILLLASIAWRERRGNKGTTTR